MTEFSADIVAVSSRCAGQAFLLRQEINIAFAMGEDMETARYPYVLLEMDGKAILPRNVAHPSPSKTWTTEARLTLAWEADSFTRDGLDDDKIKKWSSMRHLQVKTFVLCCFLVYTGDKVCYL